MIDTSYNTGSWDSAETLCDGGMDTHSKAGLDSNLNKILKNIFGFFK